VKNIHDEFKDLILKIEIPSEVSNSVNSIREPAYSRQVRGKKQKRQKKQE